MSFQEKDTLYYNEKEWLLIMSDVIIPKNSGATREFSTGAHRDASVGKGRCDLLPLLSVGLVFDRVNQEYTDAQGFEHILINDIFGPAVTDNISQHNARSVFVKSISWFTKEKDVIYLADAILAAKMGLEEYRDKSLEYMMLDVSHLYEAGAIKYGANNWRKGMPLNCYLDSGIRHYFKACAGITDEPHYRGAIWNLLCAMWTAENIEGAFDNLEIIE